jgi:hypothetical protein
MASEPVSLNDIPHEILLKIFSYFGPEELCLIIAKVCKSWNALAKDVIMWRTLSYECDHNSHINCIAQVRCTTLLVFSTNYLANFAPSTVLKGQNIKEHLRNWTSFHPEVRQVSRGTKWWLLVISVFVLCYNLDCRFCSYCGQRF